MKKYGNTNIHQSEGPKLRILTVCYIACFSLKILAIILGHVQDELPHSGSLSGNELSISGLLLRSPHFVLVLMSIPPATDTSEGNWIIH